MKTGKKRWVILTALIAFTTIKAFGQDGYSIMKRVSEKRSPKTTHALVIMNLTDQKGKTSQRTIEEWSAKDSSDNTHSVMVFHKPASVKNTRFLSKENSGKDNDQWIFIPSLNRVRRIAGSEEGNSFMGSEFSYYDMGSRELDDYSYKLLGRETVLGYNCYKIETRTKKGKESPYHKTISWVTVDPAVNTVVKIEIYQSESSLLKVMKVNKLQNISGYMIPLSVNMSNVQNSRTTTLIQQKIELDVKINTNRFSQRFLETGRAK